jgi:ATP-binding cassette, subfamily B, bacterial PglK
MKLILDKEDKLLLIRLFLLSIGVSLIETVGIAAIMPFISIATDLTLLDTNTYYNFIYSFLNFSSKLNFIIFLGFLLIFFYIFRSLINLYFIYKNAEFYNGKYYKTGLRVFDIYMNMKYEDFMKKNTSYLTKTIITETQMFANMLHSMLLVISEVMIFIFIIGVFIIVDFKVTIILISFMGFFSLIVGKLVSTNIKKKGKERAIFQAQFFEIVSKGFNNYKILKIDSNKDKLVNEFDNSGKKYSRSMIFDSVLNALPRLLLEAVSFSIVIVMIMYVIASSTSLSEAGYSIGIMSVFILGLYRLMPSINRILSGYNTAVFHHEALNIITDSLKIKVEKLGSNPIPFTNNIKLNKINYSYLSNQQVLKDISLEIKKGERIALIGNSGSGKSTLVDLIIGIIRPSTGELRVDGKLISESNMKMWRDKSGYIPQDIHLFDGSVGENIALNHDLDNNKIIEVLKKAKIWDFLLTKEGLNTKVGDKGVMLSGGQKQRIAIARALYKDPEILILDEATSALDSGIEEEIMNEIYSIATNQTLIIIAHRLKTVEKCDRIYKIFDKGIMEVTHNVL